jgi:hypothetical protein
MKVRFEHHRRPRFFSRLRNIGTGFVVFGGIALVCGIYVARWFPMFMAGSILGMGFGVMFLWFLKRIQRLYEGAYLELDADGLVVGGAGGVKTLKWTEVKSAEVIRLGSRLRIEVGGGFVLVFPFSESMKKLAENVEGTATPREVSERVGQYVEVRADWGPKIDEASGIWKVSDWLLFCLAGFLLLLHMLAVMLMLAPGSRLAQAGLLCIALLGILLALRGLVLGRAVTAVGVFRGSAARIMGWFGAGGAALAVLLLFVV